MKIYKILYQKNEVGKFYEEIEYPDGLQIPNGDYPALVPPETLKYPKWDFDFNIGWVEDKDSLIADLTAENARLRMQQEISAGAILELSDMILEVQLSSRKEEI